METKTENKENPLNTSEEIRKKAREELNRQLQGLLNDQPVEKLTDDNIEDEVNRLMEEVDNYEKNYIPKEIDENAFNELKKFEEEFGHDIDDEEDEKDEINTSNNIKEKSEKIGQTPSKNNKNEKKANFDLDLDLEDLEDYIDKDYKASGKNKKSSDITQDKEIKELLNEYERQLNIEVEREVEREYKPKLDPNDVKRADILLKNDPLLNEAIIQGIITREELILYIDYYEIFSLTTKAKKFTTEQLKALDDLCIKNKQPSEDEDESKKDNQKKEIDLNDEDAITKLTNEIEKKLESSEDILNKKLDYEKIMMNSGNNSGQNLKNILDKYNNNDNKDSNDKRRNNKSAKSDKSSVSSVTNRTSFTNVTNYTNINNKNTNNALDKDTKNNKEEKRLSITKSEISNFTTEELMSVPKYSRSINNNKNNSKKEKEKKQLNNNININDKNQNSSNIKNNTNNIFYKNNNNNEIEFHKPKTPLKPISKDKNKTYRNNTNSNLNNSNGFNNNNSSLTFVTGKKTIPPIKNNNNNNLKSKTNQRFDLFDDDGNPLNLSKFRSTRKELVKLKMGGKSKMHELFTNKPRNVEENEKLRQKFNDFIQIGKENNKNGGDGNTLKKSIVRKKIEDAQMFNKIKK